MLAQTLRAHQNFAISNRVTQGYKMTCLLTGTEELEVKEWFKHREDLLYMREVDKQTQLITDHFEPGHPLLLKGIPAHLGSHCS